MMTKYVPKTVTTRRRDPNTWITGPCPLRREKRYAWLKHRAQCKFRNEAYELTWEQWEAKWSDADFLQRGRHKLSLCLMLVDLSGAWSVDNTQVVTRHTQLKRNREYRHDRQ